MKRGFKIRSKLRLLVSYFNLLRFNLLNFFLGFSYANLLVGRIDKKSLKLILNRNGAVIGQNCDIETGLVFHNCNDYSNLIIGNNCHIGKNCFFDLKDRIIIKENVVISMQNTFITHIDLSKSKLSGLFPKKHKSITINNNAYLGTGAIILAGVELGENCFVAAGSIVNKNIEPNVMVGGVPAHKIKSL